MRRRSGEALSGRTVVIRLAVPSCSFPYRCPPFRRPCSHVRSGEAGSEPLVGELTHLAEQIGLALEANTREVGHLNVPIFHADLVWKAAKRLKEVRIALVAPETEPSRDVQRHLVTAVWNTPTRGP